MVISTIRMAIPIPKHNDALRIIKSIIMQSREDPGCLSYTVYRDIEDEDVLLLQGNWESEQKLESHVRSNEYLNLLLVLEMSRRQPEVRFDTVFSSMGIEAIERIRSITCSDSHPEPK